MQEMFGKPAWEIATFLAGPLINLIIAGMIESHRTGRSRLLSGDRKMQEDLKAVERSSASTTRLARLVLVAFLLTFMCARAIVFLIMSRSIPDLYLYVRGTHVHHLNYGIFLLSAIGGCLVFRRPTGRMLGVTALLYGVAMGLTFDEFGMWIHLGGGYWQRASWDAITVVTAVFGLIAFAPSLKRFRPYHWYTAVLLTVVLIVFAVLFVRSFRYAGRKLQPRIQTIESRAPR
jgi:hypothetical protein